MAARINAGMIRYQHEILRALVAEGHSLDEGNYLEIVMEDEESKGTDQIKEELTESRDEIYQAECEAIEVKPNPDDNRMKTLNEKQSRTVEETYELRKGELSRRYSEELVNTELIQLDDKEEYSKAQLHYHFTSGREFLSEKDKRVMTKQLEIGEGELFLPDVNRKLKGGKIWVLDVLGIKNLFEQDAEFSNESQILIDLSIKAKQYSAFIKDVLGITIKESYSPIKTAKYIQDVDTESGDYQVEGVASELEQLVEALPFAESVEDFASIIEGSPLETVEDAIALADTQPRRQQLRSWLEALQKPSEPSLGFKVGDCLKRIKGVFEGQIARITEVLEWGIETSLGVIAFSELSGWENL